MSSTSTAAVASNTMAILVSNIPPTVTTSAALKAFLESNFSMIRIVECNLQPSVQYARVVFSSHEHTKLALSLDGTVWHGSILKVQPWTLKFQPSLSSSSTPTPPLPWSQQPSTITTALNQHTDTTVSSSTSTASSSTSKSNTAAAATTINNSTDSAKPANPRFQVQREECAVFIRKIPHSVSTEELKSFVRKRIQLAFKVLMDVIEIVSCHIICKGDGSLNQACLEFSEQRMASFALMLRAKTLHGQQLDILAWEQRSPGTATSTATTTTTTPSFSSTTLEDHGSFDSSSDDLSDPRHQNDHPSEYKPSQQQQQQQQQQLHAVFVSNLPEETTAEQLSKFLSDMMVVAYKDIPTIIHCSIRHRPHNDAYVEFQTQEQVYRAIHLRNRTLGGLKLAILPWDCTFRIHNHHPDNVTNSGEVKSSDGASDQPPPPAPRQHNQVPSAFKSTEASQTMLAPNSITAPPQSNGQHTTSGLAHQLNQSFFGFHRGKEDPAVVAIPSSCEKDDGNNSLMNDSPLTSQTNNETFKAGVAIFKRQLDALRLENQGLKQRTQDSSQAIVQLEKVRIDRDRWEAAWKDARCDIQAVTAELASCRSMNQALQQEVALLRVQRDEGSPMVPKKRRKVNDHLAGEARDDSSAAMMDLQDQLADAERRFKAVTESLTQNSMTVHETVEENRKLRALLEEEQSLRKAAQKEVVELRQGMDERGD